MRKTTMLAGAAVTGLCAALGGTALAKDAGRMNQIQTLVVIYAENRSFDNLYGTFPGANGLRKATPEQFVQHDRDGSVLGGLPAVWGGTPGNLPPQTPSQALATGAPAAPVGVTQAQTAAFLGAFNHPFNVGDLYGQFSAQDDRPLEYTNRDLFHRFYENQMQLAGGTNDAFAAWADSGGLVMGYFTRNPADLPLWKWAQEFVLADNFYQGAFGGSYLNHQFLICSCAPIYPGDGTNPINPTAGGTAPIPSVVNPDGVSLVTAANSPASALDGPPVFVNSSTTTPGPTFFSVNTMQPPFPPSGNADATETTVNGKSASTLPPQTQTTIGDLLDGAKVNWAWYAGAMGFALANPPFVDQGTTNVPHFQYHHNPFNYYEKLNPATNAAYRAEHLKDGGLNGATFISDIDAGKLAPVTFYKPQGNLNEHAGYTNVTDGDAHIADVLTHLRNSPQWKNMLVVVTYDENGGWWDHAAPPKADRFGPGSRIPAIIVSPFAKQGYVDHEQYDTTSILRFITNRWDLPTLPGIARRDAALKANHEKPLGDLTHALRGDDDNHDGGNQGRH